MKAILSSRWGYRGFSHHSGRKNYKASDTVCVVADLMCMPQATCFTLKPSAVPTCLSVSELLGYQTLRVLASPSHPPFLVGLREPASGTHQFS